MQFDVCSIEFSQREAIERIRREAGHVLSSHAFTSLFLWQGQMKLRMCLLNGAYSVRCERGGLPAWFFPCGDAREARAFVQALPAGARLVYLREEDARSLEAEFPGQFALARQPDADEYLYDISGHLSLQGKAFGNMRTQVRKVERDHRVRVEAISQANRQDALGIIREWTHGEHRFAGCELRDDEVDHTAVELLDSLGMEGVIVYLDDAPMAVTAGFGLTPDTFDIVVAKCSYNLQGLSYYSKRALMKKVSERFKYINLEEDLGIPGLQTMKRGMQPAGYNRIWEAVRK